MSTEDDSTRLRVRTFPFRNGVAAEAEAVIAAPLETFWPTLLELEEFPEHVPAIDEASLEWIEDDLARCRLAGKIGVWKFGIALEMNYQMRVERHRSLELTRYEGGVFRDIYFRHDVAAVAADRTRLRSTFYFDMQGFPLLRVFRIFERFPWMAEMLNLTAAAMLVRSFQLRFER